MHVYNFMFSESVTSQQRITNPNKILAMRDVLSEVKEEDLPSHLQLGSTFTFQVSLVRASGISHDYADVFCQFKSVTMFLILDAKLKHSKLYLKMIT